MNPQLQQLFSQHYNNITVLPEADRGSSSILGTQQLRDQMTVLFKKHNIQSMFDAGCNDCAWMNLMSEQVQYHGGDLSQDMIDSAHKNYPGLDVLVHDATSDPFPAVDLLFVRDMSIHLCHQDKLLLLVNWVDSNIPWIMLTQEPAITKNNDIVYDFEFTEFPLSVANWQLDPWKFPDPVDCAYEMSQSNGRSMALWHINQLKEIINDLR